MRLDRRSRVRCGIVGLLSTWTILWGSWSIAAESPDQKEQAARADFNVAAEWQNLGSYDKAAAKWDEFIRKYPGDARLDRAHYFLGVCRLHLKKYPEAISSLQTVLNNYRDFKNRDGAQYHIALALYETALLSKRAEDLAKAAAAFNDVVKGYPDSKHAPRAAYLAGESLYSSGNAPAAVAAYKQFIGKFPNDPLLARTYYDLGIAQQELKLDADAAATYQAFLANNTLAQHELAGEVRLRLGVSLLNLKKLAEAETHFEAVSKIDGFPYADFALLRQGECRQQSDKPAEAATLFADLVKRFPNSQYLPAAQLAAGKCYYKIEKFDDAQKALTPVAAAAVPQAPEGAYWLGRTLLKLNKPADALVVLDKAVGAFAEGPFVPYLHLARIDAIYEIPARRKETLALCETFIGRFADHVLKAQALHLASLAALGQGDYAAASKHAEAFLADGKLADHPLVPAVLYMAAESYLLAAGDADQAPAIAKADPLYRKLVAQFPTHPRVAPASLRIGWCLYRSNKQAEAVAFLNAAVAKLKDPAHLAEAQLLIGRSHSAGGRQKEAVVAFDAALKAKPDWPRADEVLVASAKSLRELGDLPGAAERLGRLCANYAESKLRVVAVYQLGEIAQEQEKHDDAIKQYKEVVEKHAQSEFAATAYFRLGAVYFAKEDYANAAAALGKLLEGKSDPELAAKGQYLRGRVYQRLKQFDPAAKDLEAFLAGGHAGEAALDTRYELALCRIGLNQFDQASTVLAKILAEKPDYSHADKVYYEMGHALKEGKKAAEAAQMFRSLAEKLPESPLAPESWFQVGRYHEDLAESEKDKTKKAAELVKAAEAFSAGLEKAKAPDLREMLQCKLGDVRYQQKDFEQAAKVLLAQIQELPDGTYAGDGRFLAAECLFQLKRFAEALPLFAMVAQQPVEKYRARAFYRAGACAAAGKDWATSQKHYGTLIGQFATFEHVNEARYGMAYAIHQQKKLPEAATAYEQVVAQAAGDTGETVAKAHFMLGEIAFAQRQFDAAVERFLRVASGFPHKQWQARARYEMGRCFMELKQKDKAVASFQKVVDQFSDRPEAEHAARLIKELKK